MVEQGYPNALFGGAAGDPKRSFKTLAAIEFPVETGLLFDGKVTLPGGTAGYEDFSAPADPRHLGKLNAVYVDGHAHVVHAKPNLDASGAQKGGLAIDAQPVRDYLITSKGPYENQNNLYGIAHQKPDGTLVRFQPLKETVWKVHAHVRRKIKMRNYLARQTLHVAVFLIGLCLLLASLSGCGIVRSRSRD